MKKVRSYYHRINRDVFEVEVQPRWIQKKCYHQWRERLWSEVKSRWGNVCKKCGMTSRR